MNLQKLFEIQGGLDAHITKEKGLEGGQDLLPNKILALQVELGELANEWRGFKFWSKDQEPRDWYPNEKDICKSCNGEPIFIENGKIVGQCDECDGCGVHFHNPLLEEYVDGLHFLLSIGLDLNYNYQPMPGFYPTNLTTLFVEVNYKAAELYAAIYTLKLKRDSKDVHDIYQDLFDEYLMIGQQLKFTEVQVVDAYLEKNKINHERQVNGY